MADLDKCLTLLRTLEFDKQKKQKFPPLFKLSEDGQKEFQLHFVNPNLVELYHVPNNTYCSKYFFDGKNWKLSSSKHFHHAEILQYIQEHVTEALLKEVRILFAKNKLRSSYKAYLAQVKNLKNLESCISRNFQIVFE